MLALPDLHSNMSLLIFRSGKFMRFVTNSFTFQYVSINIELVCSPFLPEVIFTFQYVSINMAANLAQFDIVVAFTFQYVSINIKVLTSSFVQLDKFTFQYVSINMIYRF